jgi:hypothetical protein
MTDLGTITALSFVIDTPSPEIKHTIHKRFTGFFQTDDNIYHCKVEHRYTNSNKMKVKMSIID